MHVVKTTTVHARLIFIQKTKNNFEYCIQSGDRIYAWGCCRTMKSGTVAQYCSEQYSCTLGGGEETNEQNISCAMFQVPSTPVYHGCHLHHLMKATSLVLIRVGSLQ